MSVFSIGVMMRLAFGLSAESLVRPAIRTGSKLGSGRCRGRRSNPAKKKASARRPNSSRIQSVKKICSEQVPAERALVDREPIDREEALALHLSVEGDV